MTYLEALLKDPPEKAKEIILEAIIDSFCPGDLFLNASNTRNNCNLFLDEGKGCWDCWTTEMKEE